MAYDEYLAERIQKVLADKNIPCEQKKMFGGLSFMINGKMSVGIVKSELMARVGPEFHAEALKKEGARTMDFTGRPMEGYVFVSPDGFDSEEQLEFWVDKCVEFNKHLTS
jgi:TfoX/Sxy family transcriptional regulator of competence genes